VDCGKSTLTALASKEADMRIIGCDLYASQQTIARLDPDTGEVVEKDAEVGLEATGSMGWFLQGADGQRALGVLIRPLSKIIV
jgi:hypothetical protein